MEHIATSLLFKAFSVEMNGAQCAVGSLNTHFNQPNVHIFCVRIDDNNSLFGNTIALDTTQIHIKLTQTKPNEYNLKLNNVFVGGTNHHNEYSVSIIESFEMKWSHFLRYIAFIDNNIVN